MPTALLQNTAVITELGETSLRVEAGPASLAGSRDRAILCKKLETVTAVLSIVLTFS